MADVTQSQTEELKTEETAEGEKVLVDKITFDNILTRLADLEGKKNITTLKKPLKHTARVRFTEEGNMVIGYGKTKEKKYPNGRDYLTIEVRSIDEKGKEHLDEVDYLPFMEQGKQVVAEILEKKVEEQVINRGMVFKTKVDYDNYRSYQTDDEVPLNETIAVITYKLKLPDGKVVELSEEALN